jgi:hypothetical protein
MLLGIDRKQFGYGVGGVEEAHENGTIEIGAAI